MRLRIFRDIGLRTLSVLSSTPSARKLGNWANGKRLAKAVPENQKKKPKGNYFAKAHLLSILSLLSIGIRTDDTSPY
ncbi:hypothetical protein HRF87_17180 [Bacillus sp. CRN 9]|nr:hypothetical protein [Bacillus sp. CRN 9]